MNTEEPAFDPEAIVGRAYRGDKEGVKVFEPRRMPAVKVAFGIGAIFLVVGFVILIMAGIYWSAQLSGLTWAGVLSAFGLWAAFSLLLGLAIFILMFFVNRETLRKKLILTDLGVVCCRDARHVEWSIEFDNYAWLDVVVKPRNLVVCVTSTGLIRPYQIPLEFEGVASDVITAFAVNKAEGRGEL